MSKEIREQTEGEKKLSQLLGEYMEEKKKNPEGFLEISTVLMTGSKAMDVYMVSKSFGFIKRLVDNDKIDLEKVEKKFYNEICITDYGDKDRAYGKSDLVISVLSISENPIEDLISYLK